MNDALDKLIDLQTLKNIANALWFENFNQLTQPQSGEV